MREYSKSSTRSRSRAQEATREKSAHLKVVSALEKESGYHLSELALKDFLSQEGSFLNSSSSTFPCA